MPVSYYNSTKQRVRITLDIDAYDDFNPRQIDWEKMFNLEEDESVECYIEDLNLADSF